MDTRRILEIFGGVMLGSGLTVVGYELAGPPSGDSGRSSAVAESEAATADADGAVMGGAYADSQAGETGGAGEGVPDKLAGGEGAIAPTSGPFAADDDGHYQAFTEIFDSPVVFDAEAEARFPKHGLVTSGAVIVRERADLESKRMGMLRAGTRVRVDAERSFGGGCSKGWHAIFPKGWICLKAALKVGEEPPEDGQVDVAKPNIDEPMPLDYWRVNHGATPFFHRLPSWDEQERADAAGQAWLQTKGSQPMPTHPDKRPDDVPAVVKDYQNAGYYVTIASEHVRSKRHFLRTNRGTYARKYQLEKREGSQFRGVVLPGGAEDLPVYWIVRELPLKARESEGSGILNDTEITPERRSRYPFKRKVRIGDYDYYEDEDGKLLRAYAVGKAYKLKRPAGVGADENWVHVDLSEQTLVAYNGDKPVFTTIVSTGKEPGMTPVGVHRIQSKFIATSMRDQPEEDEAYSIEDVPWTQYFHNNVALHGAFWHGGFGLVRSHGCVNLSPADARWLFGFTGPHLPDGWDAVMTTGESSVVVITE